MLHHFHLQRSCTTGSGGRARTQAVHTSGHWGRSLSPLEKIYIQALKYTANIY